MVSKSDGVGGQILCKCSLFTPHLFLQALSLRNINELGSLVSGLDANLFYSVNIAELAQATEGVLLRHITRLSAAQQHAIVSQVQTSHRCPPPTHLCKDRAFLNTKNI